MGESTEKNISRELVGFINDSPTMYNAVLNAKEYLKNSGFEEIDIKKKWKLAEGGKYYLDINSSSLVAFVVNGKNIETDGFRIIGSHTDSPTFKIKSNPEVRVENYTKLNVEPYGGMIISTWFDRPLSIAGRVIIKNWRDCLNPIEKIIDFKRPLCIIPNLAIHMNRDVNNGYTYDKQNDIMPILLDTNTDLDENILLKLITNEINSDREVEEVNDDLYSEYANIRALREKIKKENDREIDEEDILDYELYLYPYEEGSLIGENEDFISCARLDNLASVHSSLKALVDSCQKIEMSKNANIDLRKAITDIEVLDSMLSREFGGYEPNINNTLLREYSGFKGINLIFASNNEEVGSETKEGANSSTLSYILERIALSLGKTREDLLVAYQNSFMISADLAHALHPNKQEKSDPTNKTLFGNGPTIKSHAGKAYASDSKSISIYKGICDSNKIKYQMFVNRSDMRSGSTIGPMMSAILSLDTVDVGIPLLAMHSSRELAHTKDYFYYYKSMLYFFSHK